MGVLRVKNRVKNSPERVIWNRIQSLELGKHESRSSFEWLRQLKEGGEQKEQKYRLASEKVVSHLNEFEL